MRWFETLSSREKLLIALALPIIVLVAGYLVIWMPLQERRSALRAEIAAYRMVEDTATLTVLSEAPALRPVNDTPIATRITGSAETAGLSLRRIEPEGQGMRVTIEDTPFATVLSWLSDLEQSQSLTVAAIEMDRRPAPGIVTARLLLEPLP